MIPILIATLTWFPIAFTAPGAAVYHAYLVKPDGSRIEVPLQMNPVAGSTPITPRTRGMTEHAYVAVDDAQTLWRAGGQGLYIEALGDSVYRTNLVLLAAGVPDTLLRDVAGWSHTMPYGWKGSGNGYTSGWAFPYPCLNRPGVWCVNFQRSAIADSLMRPPLDSRLGNVGPIIHMEVQQRALKPWSCAMVNKWALRGVWQPCLP